MPPAFFSDVGAIIWFEDFNTVIVRFQAPIEDTYIVYSIPVCIQKY